MSIDAEKHIFSALVGLAKADGVFTPAERAWILQVVDEADLEAAEGETVDRDALKQAVATPQDRRDFLKFALMTAMADGEISPGEVEYLRQLSEDFDVPAGEFHELHQTVLRR